MKIWLIRILLFLMIVWWMYTIFDFSADTGVESQSLSDKITIKVVHIIEKDYDNLSLAEQEKLFDCTSFYVRKTGHFGEYVILSVLVSFLLITYEYLRKHRKILLLISVGVGFIYALTDELHQGFVDGRTPKIFDVMVDTAGAICGTLFIIIMTKIIMTKRGKR